MAEQEKGALKNEDEGDDNLKQELLRALAKADSVPEDEFDSEEVIDILNMLGQLEKKEAQKKENTSPNEEIISPEERTSAFIERFNKQNGTKFVKSLDELKAKEARARKNLTRAVMVCILLFVSFGIANQVTMASANQSIFEFLGMKAERLVYDVNTPSKVENPNVVVHEAEESNWNEVVSVKGFPLYMPSFIPEGLKIDEVKQNIVSEKDREIYITYSNEQGDVYLQITVFAYLDIVGGKSFFIGDEWQINEIALDSGELITLYSGDDVFKTMFYKDKVMYILSSNIQKSEFISVINSMEVVNEKNY